MRISDAFGASWSGVVAGLVMVLLVAGSGQGIVPDEATATRQVIDGACDQTTKQCVIPDLYPHDPPSGTHQDYWLELVRPYVSNDVYQALREIWPDGGVPPPVPLPERPTTISIGGDARGEAEFTLLGIELNVTIELRSNSSVRTAHGGPYGENQVPCSDVRGCPDLVVDASRLLEGLITTETFGPDDCNVMEGNTQEGARRLLRFTTTVPNIGDGDLVIGEPSVHPEWFEWGECHDHWHFRNYSAYRLWEPASFLDWFQARQADPAKGPGEVFAENPHLEDGYVAGHKQGFCVIDVWPYLLVEPPKYYSCGFDQGLSRGWADEYGFLLDGQFIDITGIPAGPYVLEVEVNPERLYQELDYSNGSGSVLVFVPPAT